MSYIAIYLSIIYNKRLRFPLSHLLRVNLARFLYFSLHMELFFMLILVANLELSLIQ